MRIPETNQLKSENKPSKWGALSLEERVENLRICVSLLLAGWVISTVILLFMEARR